MSTAACSCGTLPAASACSSSGCRAARCGAWRPRPRWTSSASAWRTGEAIFWGLMLRVEGFCPRPAPIGVLDVALRGAVPGARVRAGHRRHRPNGRVRPPASAQSQVLRSMSAEVAVSLLRWSAPAHISHGHAPCAAWHPRPRWTVTGIRLRWKHFVLCVLQKQEEAGLLLLTPIAYGLQVQLLHA